MIRALRAVLLGGTFAGLGAASTFAQSPGTTPTVPPPGGPPAVRNCSIPSVEKRLDSLDPDGRLFVTLDTSSGDVTLEVTSIPEGTTCFAIGREGRGTWPRFQGWDAAGLGSIGPFVDNEPRQSAGRYCYDILFGTPEGHSGHSEPECIEMPTSIAPTPTATNTPGPTPRPPGTGELPSPTPQPSVTQAPAVTPTPVAPTVGTGGRSESGPDLALWTLFGLAAVSGAAIWLGRSRG